MKLGLLKEVVHLALDTLRTNKLRSALTVLGVVIGITSIVGMTSLIRGFDQSLRDMIRQLGPNTIFVAQFSGVSVAGGADFAELLRRPEITVQDAEAIRRLAPSVGMVDAWLGEFVNVQERVSYDGRRTTQQRITGATERFTEINSIAVELGRAFTAAEVERRRRVVVLGYTSYDALFRREGLDPIGKKVRLGAIEYTVVGVLAPRPNAGGIAGGVDDFVLVPLTTYQTLYDNGQPLADTALVAVVPRDGVPRDQALREVEEVMRIRHRLTLDQPNDFDIVTQDAILAVWDQISGATFLGLVVISSIALMVGGIGVMAIMTISVTERTREIGVRKALGARRREILLQFLAEAIVLTSVGGVLGIALGSAIGITVNLATGFPISLPWWSFALGLGFSAAVGVFFGMVPAFRAARLDPIEALRYE
ncbi:MAG: ABC transporter permease [Vicinamibacterales bacterium]